MHVQLYIVYKINIAHFKNHAQFCMDVYALNEGRLWYIQIASTVLHNDTL